MAKIVKEVELEPFTVPLHVFMVGIIGKRQDGFAQAATFPLSELEPETLSLMCDEFRESVFLKAGEIDPRLQ